MSRSRLCVRVRRALLVDRDEADGRVDVRLVLAWGDLYRVRVEATGTLAHLPCDEATPQGATGGPGALAGDAGEVGAGGGELVEGCEGCYEGCEAGRGGREAGGGREVVAGGDVYVVVGDLRQQALDSCRLSVQRSALTFGRDASLSSSCFRSAFISRMHVASRPPSLISSSVPFNQSLSFWKEGSAREVVVERRWS